MPTSRRQMLEGAALCEPLAQGALDGLCGLYAAINAIRVVLAPERGMRRGEVKQLFEVGVMHLVERGLLEVAVTDGMEVGAQFRLTKVVAREARRLTGLKLSIKRPDLPTGAFTREGLLSVLDTGLHGGAAIIACLGHTHDRYTVIVGRSPTRYYLCDSYGLQWIDRASLGGGIGAGATSA
jgi:hypothetical protein